MFTIVGSGFGLYGYLPALVLGGRGPVLLPLDYREKVAQRPDFTALDSQIQWVASHREALESASGLVVAVPPASQGDWVARAANQTGIELLLLEKPLSATPEGAVATLQAANGKRVRVGYTMLYTDWYPALRTALARGLEGIEIEWHFDAHHFRHDLASWKRFHSRGGGPLRFYGIHLIAVLADLGYATVEASRLDGGDDDQPERWRAVVAGPGLLTASLDVHSRSPAARFRIRAGARGEAIVDAAGPFALEANPSTPDPRVGPLARLLDSLAVDDARWLGVYEATNALWKQAETRLVPGESR